ncbi:MAG: Crp/Fnr family transcriptional regulator [Brevundimonas sp.]|uniref:Crp/Fnr family transcriptional regulator n=1 Tax=Brevundimonas sp. TaxID=1871086 RepID=UPI00262E6085|nr:Crp/Fnr family transcriptional regulator [Brevundimonas sp.]MDI6623954.1 Crp/Fnr family transcriptional regulator [Brevundimonas sp.]MDQ7812002.1 Crp/Fnr family transcriptional regulator [Brevundimonas sp.]
MPIAFDIETLRRSEMFSGLSPEALELVVAAGSVRRLSAGTRVFAQGDPGVSGHSLLEGRVKIVQTRADGSQAVLRFIGPGEMYGTVAALMNQAFPADAVAVVDSVEIWWTIPALRQLIRAHPEIGLRSTAAAGTRLLDLQSRMGEMTGERVEQRIARTLLRLMEKAGRPSGDGVEIDFPITRQDLAEMAGSTLHTVSRTLAALDQRGVTASARRRIIVRDPRALTQLAETGVG